MTSNLCGLVPGLKVWWLACFLGLLVLMAIVSQSLSRDGQRANAPRVIVLAEWSSNGEQFVTFRPEPATAEITYADLVSASVDADAQPQTIRSFGELFPVRSAQETNCTLRYVALPVRTLPVPGRPPVAYTPGSYTVAYSPSENGCRVRVGVALKRKGIGDYAARIRNCWDRKSLVMLRVRSHQDPVFVVIPSLTNAMHGKP
ncbi:MAG TPA: hypothetical protein VEC99_17990 [Clostridia bacterium]|nr:hypothetical protein [Clostridia bacterium]